MATIPQSAQAFVQYYQSLLILQYLNKPNAMGTIGTLVTPALIPQNQREHIKFPVAPTSGTFVISYNGNSSAAINWNDTASTIQTKLAALAGLGSCVVSGSISGLDLIVALPLPFQYLMVLGANSLVKSGAAVVPVITSIATDANVQTLPLAVLNGFNLTGPNIAVGAQLDILGKYVGVSRIGYTFSGPVILNDADFLSLIQLTIVRNNSASTLSAIQSLIFNAFGGALKVYDHLGMRMSYFMNPDVGSTTLAQFFVEQESLPKPMGVQLGALIYSPNVGKFYGYSTYPLVIAGVEPPAFDASPINNYPSYQMDYPWLSYDSAVASSIPFGVLLTEDGLTLDTEDGDAIITE